jgi:hypothetical protein
LGTRPINRWPRINASGVTTNCAWVTIAALLAQGIRVPTSELYERLQSKNVTVSDGHASKKGILDAARTIGNIESRAICGDYMDLASNSVPEKVNFAVGVQMPDDRSGHRIVGYYDNGWYRFTDWQTVDNGKDVKHKVVGEKWHITYVFWFTQIYDYKNTVPSLC